MKKTVETKKQFELVDLRRLKGVPGGVRGGLATSEVVSEKIGAEPFA